jgi:UDP-N-acetylmuramyl pentapeptide phosphotransferase/UDP-N-acetylglucosamine-1-phosphate transferase
MGDAGSIPLGFLAAALGFLGWHAGHWPLWFPVLVFSPFIVDATVTLARRVLRRERFWRPHRTHYYQRLVQLGWGHRNTALAEYALMAGCGAGALWALGQPTTAQVALLVGASLVYFVLAALVDVAWRRHSEGTQRDARPG